MELATKEQEGEKATKEREKQERMANGPIRESDGKGCIQAPAIERTLCSVKQKS